MQFASKSPLMQVTVHDGSASVAEALLVGLQCPVCRSLQDHPLLYPTDIWMWGIIGRFESRPRGGTLESHIIDVVGLNNGKILCDSCKVESGLTDDSVRKLARYFRKSLSGMPFEGADWAMKALSNFMAEHLSGSWDHRYRVIEPEMNRNGSVIHGWLLDYCPCERCTAARHGRPPLKEAMNIEGFLVSSPGAGG